MTRSSAGISVPDGRPGELEALGAELGAMSGALEAASARLRALPATLDGWSGPASVSFAGAAFAQAEAAAIAAEAFAIAQQAVRRYASELRDARREARDAIEEARDAEDRIRVAEKAIEIARDQLASAEQRLGAAGHALMTSSLTAGDFGAALQEQQEAQAEVDKWQEKLRAAIRRRDEAQQDLERAQRRGRKAEQAAADAEMAVVGAYGAITSMVPYVQALRAPAQGRMGGGTVRSPGAERYAPGGSSTMAAGAGLMSSLPGPRWGELNVFVTLTGGALTGIGARQLQQAYMRAERRYGAYRPWRGLSMTPSQEITVSQSRANAGRAAQSARAARVNPLRTLGPGTVLLEPVSGYLQFQSNAAGGMDPVENAVRTGASSAGALGGAFLFGSACALTGVGTLAAGACGTGGAFLGNWAGDKFGAGVYWVGDKTYTHVLRPGWENTGGWVLDELGITD